jgi:ADP-L-glycero-D-manno-heptose 6-epimerase
MIVLTGAGGFIGSVMLGYLNKQGRDDVVIFDDLPQSNQFQNLVGKKYTNLYRTQDTPDLDNIECVIHLGANSNTLEKDWSSIYKTNVESTRLWNAFCLERNIPLIFASSAAVYGNGHGPMNQYAFSKHVSENEITAVRLRLFNVYGPNEHHKGVMASTIYHWYQQLQSSSNIRIFQNSRQYFRDFIWVEDVCKTIYYFMTNYQPGIYDLGTGKPRDFESVADLVLKTVGRGGKTFVDMSEDLKAQYQTYTRANTDRLVEAGVQVQEFLGIEDGIPLYIDYLKNDSYY